MFLPLLQTKFLVVSLMELFSELQLLTICIFAVSYTSTTKIKGGIIRVIELKTEPILVSGQQSVEMSCNISLSNGSQLDHYNATWLKGATPVSELKDNNRFTVSKNQSLVIYKPTYADVGMYIIRFQIKAHFPDQYSCIVRFLGEPVVEDMGRRFNRAIGQKLELTCRVKGYPVTITWYKDDHKISSPLNDTRVQLMPRNGQENAHLQIINLGITDSGIYRCEVWSDFFNKTVSGSLKVRVTERYAAIWPFLGLFAEVTVLCVLIFLYERYEKRKTQKRSLHQFIHIAVSGKKRKS